MAYASPKSVAACALAAALLCATPAAALNIVLRPDDSFTTRPNGAAALFAFQKAANYWNATLTNDVTMRFRVSYAPLDTGVLAQAGSNLVDVSARSVYARLAASAASPLDAVAVANLRPLSAAGGVAYRMPVPQTPFTPGSENGLGLDTIPGSVYDNDDTYNNRYVYANTANAKAIGANFSYANSAFGNDIDAELTFSSSFAFDLDPGNGIATGTYDFVSVAVHEMGHALGFVSGADFYDYYGGPAGPGRAFGDTLDWDDQSVLSVLDLYRYSTNSLETGGFTADGKRILQLDPNRGAAFAYDAVTPFNALNEGVAEFANLATGRFNGDGQQASHWKDSTGFFDFNGCFVGARQIGIMDPTSGSCAPGIVTANDLAAFDAMGYNLGFDVLGDRGYTFNSAQIFALPGLASIPEPAIWLQLALGFGVVGAGLRRPGRRAIP